LKSVGRLLKSVSRLLKSVARLLKSIARLLKSVGRLLKSVARLLKSVARLLKPVSRLLTFVSGLLTPRSRVEICCLRSLSIASFPRKRESRTCVIRSGIEGMDSRFRGNDAKGRGNDAKGRGNDAEVKALMERLWRGMIPRLLFASWVWIGCCRLLTRVLRQVSSTVRLCPAGVTSAIRPMRVLRDEPLVATCPWNKSNASLRYYRSMLRPPLRFVKRFLESATKSSPVQLAFVTLWAHSTAVASENRYCDSSYFTRTGQ